MSKSTPEPYTPSEAEIRDAWAKRNALYRSTSLVTAGIPAHVATNDARYSAEDYAEFDRWLARHDAEVAAKAWDEGHRARWRRGPSGCQCSAWSSSECACGLYGTGELLSLGDNPYRARLSSGGEG